MPSFTILEPISTGDVIDRAVRLYRRNFTPLVAITAVPTLIGYVVSVMFWHGYTSLLTSTASSRGVPVTAVWMLAAMVVAVRQALDYDSTLRAVAVCAIGWTMAVVMVIVMGLIFGPSLS